MSVDQTLVIVYGITIRGEDTVLKRREKSFSPTTGERLPDKVVEERRVIFPEWVQVLLHEREIALEGDWDAYRVYQNKPVIAYSLDSMGEPSGLVLVGRLLIEKNILGLDSESLDLPDEETLKIIHEKLKSHGKVGIQLGCRWS